MQSSTFLSFDGMEVQAEASPDPHLVSQPLFAVRRPVHAQELAMRISNPWHPLLVSRCSSCHRGTGLQRWFGEGRMSSVNPRRAMSEDFRFYLPKEGIVENETRSRALG